MRGTAVLTLGFLSMLLISSRGDDGLGGHLSSHGDSITGVFLEKDLTPTIPKHAPEKFVNITVEEGASELTLQCDGKERRVAWYKDGLKLRPSLRLQVNSTGSIRILDISKESSGVYRCFVDKLNEAKLVRSYLIQVAYKPVVLSHFAKAVYLTEGKPGHMVCCLSGFPEVTRVMWHRRPRSSVPGPDRGEDNATEPLSFSGHPFSTQELVRTPHPLNDVTCYKKMLGSVSPKMAGAYTCQAENALGWGSRSMSFDVFVKVHPYFTHKPEKFTDGLIPFSKVLKNCKAEGFPLPELTWVKFTLKAAKHMKRNSSTSSEMDRMGKQWILCPVESRTLCWAAESQEVAKSQETKQIGIFACVASNDLGTQVALTNLVDSKLPAAWQFALGIDIVDSLPCGLKVILEVFTWAPAIIPRKVIVEYHECSFSAEFSTSLRAKQWKSERIPRKSIRAGEFEIRGHPPNTLTAVRVFMRCSASQPVVSNTVYGWTKATTGATEHSCGETRQERGAAADVADLTTESVEQEANSSVKVVLGCGSLALAMLFLLMCLLAKRGARIRAHKSSLRRTIYSRDKTWTDRCANSPPIYTTTSASAATARDTAPLKSQLQLATLTPRELDLPELCVQRIGGSQSVTVINNSIDDTASIKRVNALLSPRLEDFQLQRDLGERRTNTLPKSSEHLRPLINSHISACSPNLQEVNIPHYAHEVYFCKGSGGRVVRLEGNTAATHAPEGATHHPHEQTLENYSCCI